MMPTAMLPGRVAAPTVDVRALTKIVGSAPAVQDVTFSASGQELVAITGASGSGKTMLLKLIAGHLNPSGGRIRIQGLDPRTSRLELTSRIGYVPQIRPTCGAMRPHDLLDFCGRARQIGPQLLERRLREVIALCELGDHLQQACDRLEVYAQVRVSLAQALLHTPGLLLLDDVFRGLTALEGAHLARLVEQLSARAAVLVAGDPVHLAHLDAARYLHLNGGRLEPRVATVALPLAAST
jgi:ABC-2 type transport system ATP-binding protein